MRYSQFLPQKFPNGLPVIAHIIEKLVAAAAVIADNPRILPMLSKGLLQRCLTSEYIGQRCAVAEIHNT